MDLGPCFVYVCFHVHVYNEKQAQLGVVHGPGPQRWSMDRVHGVVHGPGPQGWSMDPGPCFVYVQYGGCWLERNRWVFRCIHVMIISKYTFVEFLNEMES